MFHYINERKDMFALATPNSFFSKSNTTLWLCKILLPITVVGSGNKPKQYTVSTALNIWNDAFTFKVQLLSNSNCKSGNIERSSLERSL